MTSTMAVTRKRRLLAAGLGVVVVFVALLAAAKQLSFELTMTR